MGRKRGEREGKGGYIRARQQIPQLQGLDEIRVPDHGPILSTHILERLIDLLDPLHTLIQGLLCSEHANIGLHDLLHRQSNLSGRLGSISGSDLVQHLDGLGTSIGLHRLVRHVRLEVVTDGVRDRTAEDDQVEKGVGTETVGTVDGHAGGFTAGEETGDDLVVALLVDGQDLTSVLGGDTTHVVVHGGQDGDRLLRDVDTGEDSRSLGDTGEALVEDIGGQVGQLEVDVVLVGADTAALTDLHGHGSGDDISGCQVLGGGGISLHESFTLGVEKVSTLATGSLGDQTSGTVDTGRVELHEFEILVGETGTGNHGGSVSGTGVRRGAREVGSSVTTCGKDGVVGEEAVEGTVFLVVCEDTLADAVLHDQVEGEVFNEVVGVVS